MKNLAELCKGSTADSDSVCLGSNPSSAAKRKTTIIGWSFFLFFWLQNRGFSPSSRHSWRELGSHLSGSRRGARLPAAKRKIFAIGEYPSSAGNFSPSGKLCIIGFAYHAQSASSLLVSGKRRYLPKEYPSSDSSSPSLHFLRFMLY